MAEIASITGFAGQGSLGGTPLAITKWNMKITREMAKSTDSSSLVGGVLYQTMKYGEVAGEGTLEGNYDPSTTNSIVIAQLTATAPASLELDYSAGHPAFTGTFWVSDFTEGLTVPGAEMVAFTATLKSDYTFTAH